MSERSCTRSKTTSRPFGEMSKSRISALRENSEKRPIGGDLSVLLFLGWLASGFQPGAADLGQLPAESIAVSESLES